MFLNIFNRKNIFQSYFPIGKYCLLLLVVLLSISSNVNASVIVFDSDYRMVTITDIYETNISNLQDSGIFSFIYYFPLNEENTFNIDTEFFNINGEVTTDWFYSYTSVNYTDKIEGPQFNYNVKQFRYIYNYYGLDFCWGQFHFTHNINLRFTEPRNRYDCGLYSGLSSTTYLYKNYTFGYPAKINISSSTLNNILKIQYVPYLTIGKTVEQLYQLYQKESTEGSWLAKIPWGLGNMILFFLSFINLTGKFITMFIAQPYLLIMMFWTLAFPICINRTSSFFGLIREILEIHAKLIGFIMNIISKIFSGVMSIIHAIAEAIPL